MSTEATDSPVRANAFGCITIPFLLIALIPLGWGARASLQDRQLLRDGHIVNGRVVELRHVPSNPTFRRQRASTASPVVTYTTRSGQQRTAVGSVNRGPSPWAVGETVAIVYDPSNPERADLVSELESWGLWLALWCAASAVPAAIALLPVIVIMRQRRT